MKDNKIEIVKDLVTFGQGSSIRQIANRVKIPYANVYKIIKKLELDDLVTLEKIGSSYRCSLNKKKSTHLYSKQNMSVLKTSLKKILI